VHATERAFQTPLDAGHMGGRDNGKAGAGASGKRDQSADRTIRPDDTINIPKA